MKRIYGLVGYPLGHSFSRSFFQEKFAREGIDADYENFEMADLRGLRQLIADRPELCGLNVTIPYKQLVIPYCDVVDPKAAAIGAVNTIVNRDGRLYGDNTDFAGMAALIRRIGVEWAVDQCRRLKAAGVPVIHFYTMGRAENVRQIIKEVF